MRLDKLHIENFRGLRALDCEFDGQLNLIIGWNGSGKSSLLLAIRAVLYQVGQKLAGESAYEPLEAEDVRFEIQEVGSRIRREQQFPNVLIATCTIDNAPASWKFEKDGAPTYTKDLEYAGFTVAEKFKAKLNRISNGEQITLPFLTYYGAKRNTEVDVTPIALDDVVSTAVSRSHGYHHWRDALVSANDLRAWVIGKTLENLQIHLEEGSNSIRLVDNELALLNELLLGILPGVKGLRFDLRLRLLAVEYDDQTLTPFDSLSDGQRSFFLLIADIARRILIINPHLNRRAFSETPGIVIIDELDIHLHPDWQRRIIKALQTAFPQLQIFATTHSPTMLTGIAPEKVVVLAEGKASRPQVTYGLDVSQVLEDVMQTGSRESSVEEQIESIFSDIDNRNFERAKEKLNRLKSAAPSLPEYIQAEALIRRLELTGK